MDPNPEVLAELRDGFAVLTMNRPEKRNALTASLLESLTAQLERLQREGDARCVVLRGAGDDAFSVGMDLTAMAEQTPEENQRLIGEGGPLRRATAAIEDHPFPVIAMVKGFGIGAACELAVSCDLRVGCGQTRMGMPPAKLGILYPPEGMERFVMTLGFPATRKLFYSARYFDGPELFAMDVLDFMCGDELEGFTFELARDLAANAPLSMIGEKRTLRAIADAGGLKLDAGRRHIVNDLVLHAMRSDDAREGIAAFLEKRRPDFKGQ